MNCRNCRYTSAKLWCPVCSPLHGPTLNNASNGAFWHCTICGTDFKIECFGSPIAEVIETFPELLTPFQSVERKAK